MKKYPFKFLDSYDREDRGIFFGRDEEINALYEMVFQSSVILVYGASGTGKTSLINCGLAGKFQPHDWLALMIRRGGNINDSLQKALNDAGGDISAVEVDINWQDEWADEAATTVTTLSPVAKSIKAVYQKSFRPVYLIFDQFEELFILGSIKEQELFIKTVHEILQSQQPVKLIFSIREEYLGHLFEFERAVPQLMRKKLRIEPMNLEKVKQVIIGAAEFENSNIRLKPGESEQIAEGIFKKIKGKSLTIQLPFLQVFLDKFYMKITGDESREANAEFSLQKLNEMGEIGDVLINFLEEQVAGISKKLKEKYARLTPEITWKILSPFSTLEGTKEPINKKDLYDCLNDYDTAMVDDIVDAFINSRILRYNEATDMFEIAHDSIAKPIAEKRSAEETSLLEIKRLLESQVAVKEEAREYFTEKQLIFIEPCLKKFKVSDEERNWINKSGAYIHAQKEAGKKKRRKRVITAGIIIMIVFTLLLLYAFEKTRESKRLGNIDFARKLLIVSRNAEIYGDYQGAALISRAAYLFYKDNDGKDFNNFYMDMFDKLQLTDEFIKEKAEAFVKTEYFDSSFLFSVADKNSAKAITFINGYVYSGHADGKIITSKWAYPLLKTDTFFDFKKYTNNTLDELQLTVTSIAVSKEKNYLAVGGGFPFVQLFDLRKKANESVKLNMPDENDYTKKVFFTDNNNLLVFTGNGNLLMMDVSQLPNSNHGYVKWNKKKQFNYENGKYISLDLIHKEKQIGWNSDSFSIPGVKFNCVSVFKDIIAIGIDSGVVLLKNDSLITMKLPGMGITSSIQFDSRGEYLYIGSEKLGENLTEVKLYKVKLTDFSVEFNQSQAGSISDIACSNDGNFIATASEDGSVGIYNIKDEVEWKYNFALVLNFPDALNAGKPKLRPTSLAFSNDNKYLLAGYQNGNLYKWPVSAAVLADLICDRVKISSDSVYAKYIDNKARLVEIKNYICKDSKIK